MHVLRLCSVYETAPEAVSARGYDAVGGLQIHAARLTEALDDRGVRQTVVTAYRPRAPRTEHPGIRSHLIRVGVPVRRFRQLYGAAAIEVGRVTGVDLVHVHLGEDLAIAPLARWAASRADVPLVATVHCSLRHTAAPHDVRSALLRVVGGPVQSWLLRRASAVLVLNGPVADAVVRGGVDRWRVRGVPLGIELEETRPLRRPDAMDDRRWVVYAGRLVPEKGVRELIQAFGTISSADAGLLVVGDGPDRRVLERAARRAAEDRVRFVGAVPHAHVRAYLHHAELVVLPSRYEERGRVLLEAMAEGRPVVATRTGGIPDTVHHGENGLLVAPGDVDGLAEAIDRLSATARSQHPWARSDARPHRATASPRSPTPRSPRTEQRSGSLSVHRRGGWA